MSSGYQRVASTGVGAALIMLALAVIVGLLLGLLTKAALVLYLLVTDLVWEWLPETLGLDAEAFLFVAVVLVVGGLLVALGQRRLGYLPEPLEETTRKVRHGEGIDVRTVPAVLGNTLPALGAGAPLGPESGLIAVVGGVYSWFSERMEATATRAFHLLRGDDDEVSRPWRYAPTLIAALTAAVVFHRLPGGVDLSFVPVAEGDAVGLLVLALAAGIAGGGLGAAYRRTERRARSLRLFDRLPWLSAPLAGLAVAVLAIPSSLVLFSGAEEMADLFAGEAEAAELLYAGVAKLLAVALVLATGWKGGTIFPLMFIAGALAVGLAEVSGLDAATLYAAAIAGAVAGSLRSPVLGALIALLVVPASLLLALAIGAAGGGIALRAVSRPGNGPET